MAEWQAIDCAAQYLGMKEVPGHQSNPAILAMLKMDMRWPEDDATPWCSAFANWVAFNMGFERTKSLRARSWLTVGTPISPHEADGNTVVIFSRGRGKQPGPEIINAPGHVAFYVCRSGINPDVVVIGGNQGDRVSKKTYPESRVLGYRRLARL